MTKEQEQMLKDTLLSDLAFFTRFSNTTSNETMKSDTRLFVDFINTYLTIMNGDFSHE